jgi:hypothetical protein
LSGGNDLGKLTLQLVKSHLAFAHWREEKRLTAPDRAHAGFRLAQLLKVSFFVNVKP